MQVGDLVIYKDRYRDTIGIVVEVDKSTVTVQWADGMTLIEFESELEVINV
tara:strand:+ start:373 stop:525 length:153 start_codon:yes stop_codon:yes gene_type:complete